MDRPCRADMMNRSDDCKRLQQSALRPLGTASDGEGRGTSGAGLPGRVRWVTVHPPEEVMASSNPFQGEPQRAPNTVLNLSDDIHPAA